MTSHVMAFIIPSVCQLDLQEPAGTNNNKSDQSGKPPPPPEPTTIVTTRETLPTPAPTTTATTTETTPETTLTSNRRHQKSIITNKNNYKGRRTRASATAGTRT